MSVLFTLMLVAASALCGCTSQPTAETVTVLGSWTGNEQGGFLAMVRGFEQKYGIRVDYTGTRDASAVLASDLKDGNPPDLAENLTRAADVRFDASDSMPQAMENAFYSAVLEYLDSPGQLNVILRGLDQVRKAAY
jgi:ABC-type glycerol-3-phosphate transport system substrate-binding protein